MQNSCILLFALVGTAFGQVIIIGRCPEINGVASFDAASYLGKWYEWGRYFAIFEVGTKCNSATYSLNANGSVNVYNEAISELFGVTDQISGTASLVKTDVGELTVYFPSMNSEANYYILGTDYQNWAAVFSCKDLGLNLHGRFAWLLTRNKNPSEAVVAEAQAAFASQGISTTFLIRVKQDDC